MNTTLIQGGDRMKNITLSADEHLIERGREKARKENRSLNDAFRDWLAVYAVTESFDLDAFLDRFNHIKTGGPFTRDELNER